MAVIASELETQRRVSRTAGAWLDHTAEPTRRDQPPRGPGGGRRRWLLVILLAVALAVSATVGYLYYRQRQLPVRYHTARLERGRIAATVNATGTVNAVVTVQVGSQVSGNIQQLLVDYNSPVMEQQIIAQIDPASFATRVSQARATLASTQASVQVAQATVENSHAVVETARANADSARANVEKSKVVLTDARRTLDRNQALLRRALIAQSDLDTAQTAYDSGVAQLKLSEAQYEAAVGQVKSSTAQARLAEAQLAAAKAQVEQARAALQAAELDLEHTTIRSPVQGIVVSRNVDVGQTVAASLQAPTLFLIAQDLTRMQVDTNVSEADIGQVCEGQGATFTVDAYPNTTFTGHVVQVRNAPITVQNVVTYDAVVEVPNPELKLKPGMTANVTFVIAERTDVLKVPNAALRFQPPGAEPQAVRLRQDATGAGRPGRVWIPDAQGRPEPQPLTLGIADDTYTEVLSGDLQAGQEVITGVLAAATRSGSALPGFGPPRF